MPRWLLAPHWIICAALWGEFRSCGNSIVEMSPLGREPRRRRLRRSWQWRVTIKKYQAGCVDGHEARSAVRAFGVSELFAPSSVVCDGGSTLATPVQVRFPRERRASAAKIASLGVQPLRAMIARCVEVGGGFLVCRAPLLAAGAASIRAQSQTRRPGIRPAERRMGKQALRAQGTYLTAMARARVGRRSLAPRTVVSRTVVSRVVVSRVVVSRVAVMRAVAQTTAVRVMVGKPEPRAAFRGASVVEPCASTATWR